MKYLLLSYTSDDAWDPADADTGTPAEEALAAFAIYAEFQREPYRLGELVATEGLGHPSLCDPSASRPTRSRSPSSTVEFKEVLASYAVLDCAINDRASRSLGGWSRPSATRLSGPT